MSTFLSIYGTLLANVAIYSVAALSLYFSLKPGVFNLSTTGVMSIAAYAGAILVLTHGVPWPLAIAAGVAISFIATIVLAIPVLRLQGHFLAIATLAFAVVVQVAALNMKGLTRGALGMVGIPVEIGVLEATAMLVVTLWVAFSLRSSKTGRAWDAIRRDEATAATSGINVRNYKIQSFVISTVFAGLAGVMWAFTNRVLVPHNFGFGLLTDLLVYALLGGIGNPIGPVAGSLFVGTMPEWLARFNEFREIIIGSLLVVAVVYTPGGMVEGFRRATAMVRRQLGSRRWGRRRAKGEEDRERDESGIADTTGLAELVGSTSGSELRVEGLSKHFGGVTALDGVSFAVSPGEVVALIGPNGAGKTTLVNCVSALTAPDGGEIYLGDENITAWSPHVTSTRGRIRRTFQHSRVLEGLSVLDNLLIGLHDDVRSSSLRAILKTRRHRRQEGDARRRALAAMELVGLSGMSTRVATELPYGQQRRVELARALVAQPRVLLLDEPAAGLADAEVRQLQQLLRQLTTEFDFGVLVIEHNVPFVMDVADRVVVMNFGKIIADGPPNLVRRDPEVMEVYLGTSHKSASQPSSGASKDDEDGLDVDK